MIVSNPIRSHLIHIYQFTRWGSNKFASQHWGITLDLLQRALEQSLFRAEW